MYSFLCAQESDKLEIESFLMKYYLIDEPLNKAAGIRDIDFEPIMKSVVERSLQIPFSVVCRLEDTNEIVGVLLCSLWCRDEEQEIYYETSTRNDLLAEVHDAVTNVVHDSFWKLIGSDVNRVLHREMSSVAHGHVRRGIASQMQRLCGNPALYLEYNLDGMVSEASSIANQELLKKHGFETLLSVSYNQWKDEDGNVILKVADGSTSMELKWKSFK